MIPRRDIVDAILWIARTGCQWRYLPGRFPDWQAVWSQWRRRRDNGVWGQAMRLLATEIRLWHNRTANPTMVTIDGQTVKGGRAGPTFHEAGGRGGYTLGAKRSILIEILGLPLAVQVDSAKPHDVQAARAFLAPQLDPNNPALPGLKGHRRGPGLHGPRSTRRQAHPRARHQAPASAGPAAAEEAQRQAEEGPTRLHAAPPALRD